MIEKETVDTSTAYHLLYAVKWYLILPENRCRGPSSFILTQGVRKQSIITLLHKQTEISTPFKLHKSMIKQSSFTHQKLIYFADKEAPPSFTVAQVAAMGSLAVKSECQVATSQTHISCLHCPLHRQIAEQHPVNRILYTDQAKHGNPACIFHY